MAALVVAALVLIESTPWAQDACVWGFDPDETVLDGEYVEEASTDDGFPDDFKMVSAAEGMACGDSMLYVAFSNGQWKIISDLGNPLAALASCGIGFESSFVVARPALSEALLRAGIS